MDLRYKEDVLVEGGSSVRRKMTPDKYGFSGRIRSARKEKKKRSARKGMTWIKYIRIYFNI